MRSSLLLFVASILVCSSKGDIRHCEDENAHYVTCGTGCEPTCAYPKVDPNCNPMCIMGCQCLPGYVLHKSKCIRETHCPKQAEEVCNDPYAEYTYCGSNCPATCENPIVDSCDDACFIGCQCKEGYLLHNSKCIEQPECPQV